MAVARQFVWLVKESSLGTVMATPAPGVDSIFLRLTEDFTVQPTMLVAQIPYGGGVAIAADQVCDHYQVGGQLRTKLYPQQAKVLLGWAGVRVDQAATPPAPWVTTEPSGDLASMSIYHAVMRSDGTFLRKRYAGAKVASWTLEASRQAADGVALTMDLIASRSYGNQQDGTADPDAVEFPAPTDADYPTGPYTFSESAGHVTVGSVRTQYESLRLNSQNVLDRRWFETPYLTSLPWMGRTTTLDLGLLFKALPNDRNTYESQTPQAATVEFVQGANTIVVNMQGANRISNLVYQTPNNEQYRQTVTLMSLYDLAAGSDLNLSFTP